jgi:hypothetical protein
MTTNTQEVIQKLVEFFNEHFDNAIGDLVVTTGVIDTKNLEALSEAGHYKHRMNMKGYFIVGGTTGNTFERFALLFYKGDFFYGIHLRLDQQEDQYVNIYRTEIPNEAKLKEIITEESINDCKAILQEETRNYYNTRLN